MPKHLYTQARACKPAKQRLFCKNRQESKRSTLQTGTYIEKSLSNSTAEQRHSAGRRFLLSFLLCIFRVLRVLRRRLHFLFFRFVVRIAVECGVRAVEQTCSRQNQNIAYIGARPNSLPFFSSLKHSGYFSWDILVIETFRSFVSQFY